jgi:hypothetical protein
MRTKLVLYNIAKQYCQLFRCVPVDPHELMRIQRDVCLAAADITSYGTSQFFLPLLLFIPNSDRYAGVRDRIGIKEQGKPWQPLFICRELETTGKTADFFD